MGVYMSEEYIKTTLLENHIGIYELRTFARVFGIKKPALKSREEIITEMSKIDMQFSLNKLEMILFWRNLLFAISH